MRQLPFKVDSPVEKIKDGKTDWEGDSGEPIYQDGLLPGLLHLRRQRAGQVGR